MNPLSIINNAAKDGVRLQLMASGKVKAIGRLSALKGWQGIVRRYKSGIIAALTDRLIHSEAEKTIKTWFDRNPLVDSGVVAEVYRQCEQDEDAQMYYLHLAKEDLCNGRPAPTCGRCTHFRRIEHPNLGHCTVSEPEPICGLWDVDPRNCKTYLESPDHDK